MEKKVHQLESEKKDKAAVLSFLEQTGFSAPQCIQNLIRGCKKYYLGDCVMCYEEFYLSKNNCVAIPAEKRKH